MKKYYLVILIILSVLTLTGCKNKSDNISENNKNQNTQINEDNSNAENVVKPDNDKNNESKNDTNDNDSNQESSKDNKTNQNNESAKENNATSNDTNNSSNTNNNNNTNNNSNNNNSNNTNTETNKLPKEVEPTIEYTCSESNDVYNNGLCNGQYTYVGILDFETPYTCPSGYTYKLKKCYIQKTPIEVKYCDNDDYILDGNLCLHGEPRKASKTKLYYKPKGDWDWEGFTYGYIDQKDYVGYAEIECFSENTKVVNEKNNTSYCHNNKGEVVKARYASCKKGLKLINNENIYQCSGIEYNYYVCKGKLVGTTCYPGELANFGMYCDDGSEIENAHCLYVTDVKPKPNYSCHTGDKKIEEENQLCLHKYTTDPQKIYKCPKEYFLGTDQKCYLNSIG